MQRPGDLAPSVESLFAATACVPKRVTMRGSRVVERAFRPKTFVGHLTDPNTRSVMISAEPEVGGTFSQVFLRDDPDVAEVYQRRWCYAIVADMGQVTPLVAFATALIAQGGCVGGGLAAHRDHWYARTEGSGMITDGRVDLATDRRLYEDAMLSHRAQTRLRRLYPFTIIGPALWAELPPMPRFDPMPTIEDFGDAKLMRAWPTLCEPRDPAFLRANRELRAWLWPYTIQNPADHVDQDPA
jgi:hypothetical protein